MNPNKAYLNTQSQLYSLFSFATSMMAILLATPRAICYFIAATCKLKKYNNIIQSSHLLDVNINAIKIIGNGKSLLSHLSYNQLSQSNQIIVGTPYSILLEKKPNLIVFEIPSVNRDQSYCISLANWFFAALASIDPPARPKVIIRGVHRSSAASYLKIASSYFSLDDPMYVFIPFAISPPFPRSIDWSSPINLYLLKTVSKISSRLFFKVIYYDMASLFFLASIALVHSIKNVDFVGFDFKGPYFFEGFLDKSICKDSLAIDFNMLRSYSVQIANFHHSASIHSTVLKNKNAKSDPRSLLFGFRSYFDANRNH